MARSYRYLHYDVFTDHLFGGNQLAVFLDGRGLSAETMQAIAKEMNFSETTFVLPAEKPGTDVRMRIFTPAEELPMAGHPTIGTTFALARAGVIERGRKQFVFGCDIGPVPVATDLEGRRSRLRVDDAAAADLRRPDSGSGADRGGAVAVAGGGRRHRAAGAGRLVRRAVSVRAADHAQRGRQRRRQPGGARRRCCARPRLGAHGVFVFSAQPGDARATVYSRMFAPELGVMEDPATGSASGPLGCYLVRHKIVPPEKADAMISLQGVKMGRPSHVHISIGVEQGRDLERTRRRRGRAGGRRYTIRNLELRTWN